MLFVNTTVHIFWRDLAMVGTSNWGGNGDGDDEGAAGGGCAGSGCENVGYGVSQWCGGQLCLSTEWLNQCPRGEIVV